MLVKNIKDNAIKLVKLIIIKRYFLTKPRGMPAILHSNRLKEISIKAEKISLTNNIEKERERGNKILEKTWSL